MHGKKPLNSIFGVSKNRLTTQHSHTPLDLKRHGAALETSRPWRDRSLHWWGLLKLIDGNNQMCFVFFVFFFRAEFVVLLKNICFFE